MHVLVRIALVGALIVSGCKANEQGGNQAATQSASATVAPILTTPDAIDTHSYARPLEARVHHVALDLAVDFDAKRIGGTATLDIDRKPGARQIVLDDNGLEISSVTDASKQPLAFHVGARDENLGTPLAIDLKPDTKRIVIAYKSAPEAGALLWLTRSKPPARSPRSCSARANRSTTGAGFRPRIRPASGRPGKRRSTCPRA